MITIRFSCDKCGLKDEMLQVPSRSLEQNVVEWAQTVLVPAIARAHTIKSLLCEAKTITAIKIPFDKDDPDGWIGKQTDQIPPSDTTSEPESESPK